MKKTAYFLYLEESLGSYVQGKNETDDEFFEEVESARAYWTREIYTEVKSGAVDIAVILVDGGEKNGK